MTVERKKRDVITLLAGYLYSALALSDKHQDNAMNFQFQNCASYLITLFCMTQ